MGLRRGIVMGMIMGSWFLGSVPHAEAHLRDYVVTQGYYTTKQGEFEVELFNDVFFPEANHDETYHSEHQIEVEYGVTNHFQVSYYEIYAWNRTEDWERDAFKIEAKLRFAEAGQWPVDVALYTEYKNPNGSRDVRSDEIENKVIVSKTFGPWNVAGNVIFGREINTHSHWAFEYTAGVRYAATPRIQMGLEVQQGLGNSDEFGFSRDHEFLLVPGLYVTPTPHVRILIGPAFGLTRGSDDLQIRSIVGVEF